MNSMLVVGIAFSFSGFVIFWLAWNAQPGIALFGDKPKESSGAPLLEEYVKDLARAVRLHRLIGVAALALLILTLCIIVWDTIKSGWSSLLILYAANGGAFLGLVRFIFRRVDSYEKLLRDALELFPSRASKK